MVQLKKQSIFKLPLLALASPIYIWATRPSNHVEVRALLGRKSPPPNMVSRVVSHHLTTNYMITMLGGLPFRINCKQQIHQKCL